MRFLLAAVTALFLTFATHGNVVDAGGFKRPGTKKSGCRGNLDCMRRSSRQGAPPLKWVLSKKGSSNFGAQIGWGYTFDLPPGRDRINIGMLFVFPNWQSNITGLVGESWYRGALFHHVEAGFANAVDRGGNWLWGFSPLMAQYKFLSRHRKWAPNILAGAGFSYGDWNDLAEREIATEFEFLLHVGAGVEFYNRTNAWSINYRLFHVSNSGIKMPNIGLNAHVFSLGMRF